MTPTPLLLNADARRFPLAADSIHLVVTSPPYYNAREYSAWDTYDDYLADMARVYAECYRVLVDGGRIAVNVSQGYDRVGAAGGYKTLGDDTMRVMKETGFIPRGHIIWDKMGLSPHDKGTAWGSWQSASNPSLRDGHEIIIVCHKGSPSRLTRGADTITRDDFLLATNSIWRIAPISKSWHPAPFPPEIPRRLIELYSYQDDVVLDPFSGSGTAIMTAQQCGRRGIGLELSYEYARVSRREIALAAGEWELAASLPKRPAVAEDKAPALPMLEWLKEQA